MKKTMKKTCAAFLVLLLTLAMLPFSVFAAVPDNEYGIDEEGYVVYEIGLEDIDPATGTIHLDGTRIANALRSKQWAGEGKVNSNWMPGEWQYGMLKLVNTLPYAITISDYRVYIPSYGTNLPLMEATAAGEIRTELFYGNYTSCIGAKGVDGNEIPIGLTPFRTANVAIRVLYEKTGSQITLEDLIRVEETLAQKQGVAIKNAAGQELALPDSVTTYADYICWYYGVDDLNDLTGSQKSKIFDGNSFYVSKLGEESILQDERARRFACSENGGSIYLYHETDKDMVELGYNFFLSDLFAFSYDTSIQDLKTGSMADYTLANYLDGDSVARTATDAFLLNKTLEPGDSVSFDSLQLKISGPLMGNAYSNREVPNMLTFDLILEPVELFGYAYEDSNDNGIYDEGDFPMANIPVTLYKSVDGNVEQVGETVMTDENGYYSFGKQPAGVTYYLTSELPEDYALGKVFLESADGNRFELAEEAPATKPFEAKIGSYQHNIGFVEVGDIPDDDPPLVNPDTGRDVPFLPVVLIAAASGVALATFLLRKKKEV